MTGAIGEVMLYPLEFALSEGIFLQLLTEPAVDVVTFPENGGTSDLGLAVPFLPDMDTVVVEAAEITLRADPLPGTHTPTTSAHAGGGVSVTLGAGQRLTEMVVDGTWTPDSEKIVVSALPPDGAASPVFVDPELAPASTMFPVPLSGMTRSDANPGTRLRFPSPLTGERWLIQIASGTDVGSLIPKNTALTVRSVTLQEVPTDLAVVIPGEGEEPDGQLYANPGQLLPDLPPQQIVFTPLAQRHLDRRLSAGRGQPGLALLTVPLRLSSTTAGTVAIVTKTLDATYRVTATAPDPVALRTGGEPAVLALTLPAGRRPTGCAGQIVCRTTGRELDGPVAMTAAVPGAGVVVTTDRWAAATAPFEGSGQATADLASVRLFVAADRAAEVVLELRQESAGAPGPVLASVVAHVVAGPPGWLEFALPSPLPVAVPAVLWCALRTNDEPVRWFGAPGDEPARVSVDRGASWGAIGGDLTTPTSPLIQLFRIATEPPRVDLYLGAAPVGQLRLVGGADSDEVRAPLELPPEVLSAIATTTGQGRVVTELRLVSRTVLDLSVRGLACSYDPFAA
jgi:hypothetical protein